MSEVNQTPVTTENQNTVVCSYVISRYENGDITVDNNTAIEGIAQLSSEALYKDIEDVADIIRNRRIENASYRGIQRFYADMQAYEEQQAAAAQAQGVNPTV